jgi:hypothetical protein
MTPRQKYLNGMHSSYDRRQVIQFAQSELKKRGIQLRADDSPAMAFSHGEVKVITDVVARDVNDLSAVVNKMRKQGFKVKVLSTNSKTVDGPEVEIIGESSKIKAYLRKLGYDHEYHEEPVV